MAQQLVVDTEVIDTSAVNDVLAQAHKKLQGIKGLMLAGTDGRAVGHRLDPATVNPTAAVSASSLQLARRLADLLGEGDLNELTMRSEDGYVVLYAVGPLFVLTVLTLPTANIAMINHACRDIRKELLALVEKSYS